MVIDVEYIKNIMTNVFYSPNYSFLYKKYLYDMGNVGISLSFGRYDGGEAKLTITMKKNFDVAHAFNKFFHISYSNEGTSFYFGSSDNLRCFNFSTIEHCEFKMSQNTQCAEYLSIESDKAKMLQNQNFDNEQMLDGEIILYGFLEKVDSLPNRPINYDYI